MLTPPLTAKHHVQFVAPVLTLRFMLTLPSTLRFGTRDEDPWGVPRKQSVVRSRPLTRPFASPVSRSLDVLPDSGVQVASVIVATPAPLRPWIHKVNAADYVTRAKMRSLCLPAAYARGWYTVPLTLLPRVEAMLAAELERREELIGDVLAEAQKHRRTRPPAGQKWVTDAQLTEAFEVRKEYLSIASSPATQGVSEELYASQMHQWRTGQDKLAAKCRILLRGDLLNSAHALRIICDDALRSVHIGAPIVSSRTLERVQFQARIFPERDATADQAFLRCAHALSELLSGVTVTALKKYNPVRDHLRENLETIEARMKIELQ